MQWEMWEDPWVVSFNLSFLVCWQNAPFFLDLFVGGIQLIKKSVASLKSMSRLWAAQAGQQQFVGVFISCMASHYYWKDTDQPVALHPTHIFGPLKNS